MTTISLRRAVDTGSMVCGAGVLSLAAVLVASLVTGDPLRAWSSAGLVMAIAGLVVANGDARAARVTWGIAALLLVGAVVSQFIASRTGTGAPVFDVLIALGHAAALGVLFLRGSSR